MAIDHFFAPSAKAQPETGAERELLLRANHDLKRQNVLLQARVDELVGQVSKMQAGGMVAAPAPEGVERPPRSPRGGKREGAGAKPRTRAEAAAVYLDALRSFGRPATSREVAELIGYTPPATLQWFKGTGMQHHNVVITGYHKGNGTPAPLYAIKAAS